MVNRVTHTFAILEISAAVYKEIYDKLKVAGYEHAFIEHEDGEVIDMHGIALGKEKHDADERPEPIQNPIIIGNQPDE